ncbi:MAG: ATP-binding protein [Candidatus Methanoplasma sp.]|jgi:ABC-type ATPase involved in cell division|nr:ATP-binding protein [Candidatus Methanoplasma sp.]
MRLVAFSVYGLFNEFDYEINLTDGPMTFIHSQNGYGKSTVMRLIHWALSGDREKIGEVLFSRMDLTFSDGSCMILENSNGEVVVQMQKNDLEEQVTDNEMKIVMRSMYISPERYVVPSESCGHYDPALYVYHKELAESMRDAVEDGDLPAADVRSVSLLSDEELEFRCKDLKAKLDFMKQAGIEPDMPSGYRFPPARYEIMEWRKDYDSLAASVESYVNKYFTLAESLVVYLDIINGMFINKEIYINDKNGLNVRMTNGTALPINRLSSGEEQLLIIFYQILFQTAAGSLVIIDEPEISLHVSWQQRIGSILVDIARLRDLQMLVATHSPQIIHDRWDAAVELKAGQ